MQASKIAAVAGALAMLSMPALADTETEALLRQQIEALEKREVQWDDHMARLYAYGAMRSSLIRAVMACGNGVITETQFNKIELLTLPLAGNQAEMEKQMVAVADYAIAVCRAPRGR